MSRKLTTEDFIKNARRVHGDRYDYSAAVYTGANTKLEIRCFKHGPFLQTPANHGTGKGCLLCGFENAGQYHKKNNAIFIEAAKALHGKRYDYSLVEYRGARERVTIICPIHGAFEQVASTHLRPAGCEACSYQERAQTASLSRDEFLERARAKHGTKFDYSQMDYENFQTLVTIVCPLHGSFDQKPRDHILGAGCPKCGYFAAGQAMRKSTDNFIREARKKHGQKYDYSKSEYVGARSNITIICPKDGEFEQIAGLHIAGTGCPKCSRRNQPAPKNLVRALRGEFDGIMSGYVYIARFRFPYRKSALYKVGSGSRSRLKTLEVALKKSGATDLQITRIDCRTAGEAVVIEHLAHEQVRLTQHVVPPAFKFAGHTEVFTLRPNMRLVLTEPILKRYQSGERWDPRSESAGIAARLAHR